MSRERTTTGPEAVIYIRPAEGKSEIVWHDVQSGHTRPLYTCGSRGMDRDRFGFLPSPDGRRMLVWDCVPEREGEAERTGWVVVSTADARVEKLGESGGIPGLLPYWEDSDHLVLAGEHGSLSLDLAAGARQWPSGAQASLSRAETRELLLEYCSRHYAREREALLYALDKHSAQLGVAAYYGFHPSEPREYLLLRSLGIPGMEALWYPRLPVRYPHVGVSPDGALLARAYMGDPVVTRVGTATVKLAETRLDVLEVASGEVLWGTKVTPRSRPLPRDGPRINPAPLPWVDPQLADIRWSRDGRFLSFSTLDEPAPRVTIVDTAVWREVLCVEDGVNAFVVSEGSPARRLVAGEVGDRPGDL